MAFRATSKGNRAFCEGFFTAAASTLSQGLGWWQDVVRFAFRAMTGRAADGRTLDELWRWATTERAVAAVDLVPFHSAKDGITRLIEAKPARNGPRAELRSALRHSAQEAFKMVLHLGPKVVLVASRAGTRIVEDVMEEKAIHPADLWCEVNTLGWGHQFRYKLHHFLHEGGGRRTHVLTMPTQLFSRQAAHGGRGVLRKEVLPDAIYGNCR